MALRHPTAPRDLHRGPHSRGSRGHGKHFEYLKSLLEAGKLILAGPSLDSPFGIIVLEAVSEEEARRLIAADPSVAAVVQTPELHPFRASLLKGREP